MAKSRRNRAKAGGQRSNPIAKPVKPPSDPELAAIREKSILPVLKDLQSTDLKSRTAAVGAIANIVQDTRCRKLLLREQVVHILLTQTLTDASLESRAAGWEILRVITAEEDADFCVHLYRVDVLTAVQHAAANIIGALSSPIQVFSKRPKAEQKLVWSITEAVTEIVSAMAAAQDEALLAASQNQEILRFLFALVSNSYTIASVLESALSCMITMSEDNRPFCEALLGDSVSQCYKHLIAFKNGGDIKAALACSILHNVFSAMDWNDQSPGRDGTCDAILVPSLCNVVTQQTQMNSHITDTQSLISRGHAVQIALEVLASIGTILQHSFGKGSQKKKGAAEEPIDQVDAMDADEDSLSEDDEPTSEDNEMDDDELEADLEMVTGVDDDEDQISGIDDLPTLKELISHAISLIVALFKTTQEKDELSTLIRTHALIALSNISWTVSCLDFSEGANAGILQAWKPAARTIWGDVVSAVLRSNTSDVDLATIVTSLAWAIARVMHGQILSGDEHNKFISLYHASKGTDTDPEDPLQSLGVKCIGVLGQLALDPAPVNLNREIGVFLVTVVASLPETPVAEAAEALNQLFDIYGDENSTNDREVFWKDNFLQHIKATIPKVKAMIKTVDKRKLPELRTRAEEASLNLTRFVQYKHKHQS